MIKPTKLIEKSARIPDTREAQWHEIIQAYLSELGSLHSESARSFRFGVLLRDLMGIEPDFIETYSSGIEKYLRVKQKDRILKGEVDNLFGNVVIEFEASLSRKRAEAEAQLRRYIAILWSQESPQSRAPYLAIATDGVRFVTYSPFLDNKNEKDIEPEDVRLEVVEETDWTSLRPREVYYWLDRYFLRKEVLHPTSETIVRDFSVKSHAFQSTTRALLALWRELKSHGVFTVVYDNWEKYLRIVYGSSVAGDELFIRHSYLATLAKTMSWMRITESTSLPDDIQIVEMLEGRLFKAQGIENFIEEDFFSWLAREGAQEIGVSTVRWLFSLLQNYNLRELSEDVLKSLYQELVDPETRHDLGEFYTPDWLAHRIVNKLLDATPHGSVLDPACGSGTFLYLTIREKRDRLHDSPQTLRHTLESVYGADVHPLAVIIAKTNYLLALGDLLKKRKTAITLPIYLADTLKPLFFKRKFDLVVGNPPWIAFRYTEPAYQTFLKKQITEIHRLLSGRGELITHLELATLFLVRAADLYLKSGGKIAFVLPRSLFSADQHDGLRKRTFRLSEDTKHNLCWREIWDCEKVTPLLSTDLLPFGHLDHRLVVLPAEPEGDHYRLIDENEARNHGFLHLAQWLEKAEKEWTKRRGTKAGRMSALGWLDYRGKSTSQNPKSKHRVIYITSGTFLTAAVVEDKSIKFEIDGQHIEAQAFLANDKTYCFAAANGPEAHYLCTVFNAPVIDKLIKPMQSRGLFGPRDIHKKVLELPIPNFDAEHPLHQHLSDLGKGCSAKVRRWLASGGKGKITSIGKLRGMVRELLKDELKEIDALVEKIMR